MPGLLDSEDNLGKVCTVAVLFKELPKASEFVVVFRANAGQPCHVISYLVRVVDDHHAVVTDAPPVYNPGGKVAMTTSWDGGTAGLDSLIGSVADEAVLLIVPVEANSADRVVALGSVDATVASGWYERTIA